MQLKEYGNPKGLGGYTVSTSYHDNTFYQPIALKNFLSVEINGSSGMSGSINVTAQQPCCAGYCACLGVRQTVKNCPRCRNMSIKFVQLEVLQHCYSCVQVGN